MNRMATSLAERTCQPCDGGVQPLDAAQAQSYLKQLPGWKLEHDALHISKKFRFANFARALTLVNQIGEIAEEQHHHPDLRLGWGYVTVYLTTHAIKGISENDFILAAKIERLTQ